MCLVATVIQNVLSFTTDDVLCLVATVIQNVFSFTTDGYVCVEVLRPSQPNGVMSSAVSLPNYTFTGQA